MKSKIEFISPYVEHRKGLIGNIIDGIYAQLDKHLIILKDGFERPGFKPIDYYVCLLYIKYLCETNNFDFSKIIEGNLEDVMPYLKKRYEKYHKNLPNDIINYKLYEVLKIFAYENYEIEAYEDRFLDCFIKKDKKYLLISSSITPYIKYPNVDVFQGTSYDKDLNTYLPEVNEYKILDEIIGIKRKYISSYNEFKSEDYAAFIYLADKIYKPYNTIKNTHLNYLTKVLMVFKYSDISNYRSLNNGISVNEIKENLQKIYIDGDKTYIEYNKEGKYEPNKKINIKLLTNIKNNDLATIIGSTKEIKDVSIFVSPETIISNNNRIGFNIYNNKEQQKTKDILDIIDENKIILQELRELDDIISKEVDKMIIK
jgi:hypothetical protein